MALQDQPLQDQRFQEAMGRHPETLLRGLLSGSIQGVLFAIGDEVVLANAAAGASFGESGGEALVGRKLGGLFTTGSAEALLEMGRSGDSPDAGPQPVTLDALGHGGGVRVLDAVATVLDWGARRALQLTFHDETDRLRAEESLAARELEFQELIDTSLQGIYVHIDHRSLFVNRTLAEMFGYGSPEEVLALGDVLRLYDPSEHERLREYYRERMAGGSPPPRYEFRGVRKDGTVFWLENLVKVVSWGGRRAILGTVIDIQERKRAEHELIASEEKFRKLIEGSIQGIVIQRHQAPLFVNQAFAELFGYRSPEEIYALGTLEPTLDPESGGTMKKFAAARLRGESAPSHYITTGRRKDGTIIKVENIVRVVNWEGQPAIQSSVIDVSERNLAERKLRESQHRLRLVTSAAPLVLWTLDTEGVFTLSEGGGLAALGLLAGEIVGRTLDVVYRDQPAILEMNRRALAGETVKETVSVGAIVYDSQLNPLRNLRGEITGVIGVAFDITERVRAERELQASQRLLRTVIDTMPHIIFVKDREGRFQVVNRAFAEYYGLTEERVVGERNEDLPIFDTATLHTFNETDRQVLTTGQPLDLPEVYLTAPDGWRTLRHLLKLPIHDEQGQVIGIVGWSEDITDRKRAEEELRSSQRLLRTVIDTIPHTIFVKDVQGHLTMVNQAYASFYDRSPEELEGMHHNELPQRVVEGDDLFDRTDRELLEGAEVIDLPEVTLIRSDGVKSIRHIIKMPLHDGEGNIVGIVGISQDITDRKRAEEELRSHRQLLQTVFDLLPLWVFVKDRERKFVMINRKMREDHRLELGIEPGALIDLSTAIKEGEKRKIHQIDRQVLDTRELIEVPEVEITLPDGETRLFRTVRMPLWDAAGEVSGIVGIAEDITERKRSEQALQQAQKLESLGVLSGGIAHDFNNLLVSIQGNASLVLLDLPPDAPLHGPIAQIEAAGQRAAELCRQLLAYAGKGTFEVSLLNLNRLIEEMSELLRVSIGKGITLLYGFDPELPWVEVDPTQIRQVVMNLVLNASEAIGRKTGEVRLATGVDWLARDDLMHFMGDEDLEEGPYVFLEVRDTGEGMPAEILGKIFDPFFTTKFTGRGLGLAGVLGIVRSHRGGLRVFSEEGRGSTFQLYLPAVSDQVEEPARSPEPDRWRGDGLVLVVDDEEGVRQVLEALLEAIGFKVLLAPSGEEGVRLLQERGREVRLVLLDIVMPGMDGEETFYRMAEMQPDLPIVLMSGYSEEDVLQRLAGSRIAGFLPKPLTLQTLRGKLKEVLG